MRTRTTLIALVFAALLPAIGGCNASRENAKPGDILAGYQPEPLYDKDATVLSRTPDEGNRFHAAVKGFEPTMEPQKNPSWCWAAAAARVLQEDGVSNADGSPITQDDLVRKFAQHRSNQAASPETMLLALYPEGADDHAEAKAHAEEREDKFSEGRHERQYWENNQPELPGVANLVNDILHGGPALVAVKPTEGRQGHIYLAYQVEFSMAATDRLGAAAPYYVHRVKAIDPYTGEAVELRDVAELKRVDLAAGRRSAEAYVRKSADGYRHAGPRNIEDGPWWRSLVDKVDLSIK